VNKFKEKFQPACCVNRNIGIARYVEEYEAGWDWFKHCFCHVCELSRKENSEERCVDKSCEGCKNLAEGKKVRDYGKDILRL
jgi:hypothetical protein